jgi:hypothetical protein
LTKGYGVSADGSIVVGSDANYGGAMIWTPTEGNRKLRDVLVAKGAVDAFAGWSFPVARAISADGTVIVGEGINPSGQHEAWIAVFGAQCQDGIDNDGDGFVDLDDPGCPFDFATTPENPPCDDGLDNDGDGLFDFDDPQCSLEWPFTEAPFCGLGLEQVALIPLATWLRRRRPRAPA